MIAVALLDDPTSQKYHHPGCNLFYHSQIVADEKPYRPWRLANKSKFRQAVAAAIDIGQIVDCASDGLATPNNSAVYTRSSYYGDVEAGGIAFDMEAAKALLSESTYNGEIVQIIANQRAPMPSYQVAIATQEMLRAIGINADPDGGMGHIARTL